MRLIVGLGNPGTQYASTRHNAGAWFVASLAKQAHARWQLAAKFHAQMIELVSTQGQTLLLAIPTTFMNLSGKSIAAIANFYKILPEEILVAHDELDLPVGTMRLKLSGGHGGHNGLRSTIEMLHSRDFYRLRMGIGHPGSREQVTPYVLSAPNKIEKAEIEKGIEKVIAAFDLLENNEMAKLMQKLNTNSF